MKKILLICSIGLLSLFACKKDGNKEDYIKIKKLESEFSEEVITVSTPEDGQVLKNGSVIFYKTSESVLGKFTIKSISPQYDKLTIDVINYNADGKVILNQPGVIINSSNRCDLDIGAESIVDLDYDFQWEFDLGPEDTAIIPYNSAKFYVYSK